MYAAMHAYISILVFLLGSCESPVSIEGKTIGDDKRIENGTKISITEAPYTVQVLHNGKLQCGGTLVNIQGVQVVLTAAHCVNQNNLSIAAGSEAKDLGIFRQVRKVVAHKGFSVKHLRDDIALLFLDSDFAITENISVAYLPYHIRNPSKLLVTGWGQTATNETKSKHLLSALMPVISTEKCKRLFADVESAYEAITEKTMCLYLNEGGTTPCWGDSGGPAAASVGNRTPLVFGIVSFGPGPIHPVHCSPKHPTVFTKVAKYIDWLEAKVREDKFESAVIRYAPIFLY